jgi:hypothetical protein
MLQANAVARAACWFFLACAITLAIAGSTARADPQQTGAAHPMELLLADNIRQADLAAHVEIVKVTVASRTGNRTRYRMDAWILERFKGPEIKEFAFVQEVEEETEGQTAAAEGLAGSRLIVALDKAANEDSYYLPKGRFSFPDHNVLIAAARRAARQ